MSDRSHCGDTRFEMVAEAIDRLTEAVNGHLNCDDKWLMGKSLDQLQFLNRRLRRIALAFAQLDNSTTSTES